MNIHGEYEVDCTDNIIACKLIGSFNGDGCLGYTEAVKSAVRALNGQPFAMLIDDLQLEGGTPEAYAILDEYNAWLSTQPLVAKALIINSLVQKDIMLQRSPNLKAQNIEFFTERETAIKWLAIQLNN